MRTLTTCLAQAILVVALGACSALFNPPGDTRDGGDADTDPNAATLEVSAARLSTSESETQILSAEAFSVATNAADDAVMITLLTTPTIGKLSLRGTSLDANDRFTLADIKAGLVSYQHIGPDLDDNLAEVPDSVTLRFSTAEIEREVVLTVAVTPLCRGAAGLAATAFDAFGLGTALSPHVICTTSQLIDLASKTGAPATIALARHYKLRADLDYSGVTNPMPIGSPIAFTGTFDGGGHIIANWSRTTGADDQGFFGNVVGDGVIDGTADGSIKNLILRDFFLSADESVGLLVGVAERALLTDITILRGFVEGNDATGGAVGEMRADTRLLRARIEGRVYGSSRVGGAVGRLAAGTEVTDTHAQAEIVASGTYAGGLIGLSFSATVNRSAAYGLVKCIDKCGGLVGNSQSTSVTASRAIGNVVGNDMTGGLIGEITLGEVTDSFASGNVLGALDVGGLIGLVIGASVVGCHATGDVKALADYAGGLVGVFDGNGPFTNSYALGNVNSDASYAGGLVGAATSGSGALTIQNVYARGSVTAFSNVGGLIGQIFFNIDPVEVREAYSTGGVTGGSLVGGLIGSNYTVANVSDSFWDTDTSGLGTPTLPNDSEGGIGLTTAALKTKATLTSNNWVFGTDGVAPWVMRQNNQDNLDYPQLSRIYRCYGSAYTNPTPYGSGNGTLASPYAVCSPAQLGSYSNDFRDSAYILGETIPVAAPPRWGASAELPFSGHFDGNRRNGFAIEMSTSVVTLPTPIAIGFISYLARDDGTLGIVSDFGMSFNVSVNSAGATVGGVAGHVSGGWIIETRVSGDATSAAGPMGAIAGETTNDTLLSRVMSTANLNGSTALGSVVGRATNTVIDQAVSTGGLIASTNVGGIAGELSGARSSLVDSRATGVIAANDNAGGIVGYLSDRARVARTIGMVTVPNSTRRGGIVGDVDGSAVSVQDNFWDTTIGSAFWRSSSATSTAGIAFGMNTAAFSSAASFPGFDFTYVWTTLGDSAPLTLLWE